MDTRAGSGGLFSGSIRTVPVKYSAGPLPDGCEPMRLISIADLLSLIVFGNIASGLGRISRYDQDGLIRAAYQWPERAFMTWRPLSRSPRSAASPARRRSSAFLSQ